MYAWNTDSWSARLPGSHALAVTPAGGGGGAAAKTAAGRRQRCGSQAGVNPRKNDHHVLSLAPASQMPTSRSTLGLQRTRRVTSGWLVGGVGAFGWGGSSQPTARQSRLSHTVAPPPHTSPSARTRHDTPCSIWSVSAFERSFCTASPVCLRSRSFTCCEESDSTRASEGARQAHTNTRVSACGQDLHPSRGQQFDEYFTSRSSRFPRGLPLGH
eukprot:366125-Chlamydomonas_euryale.AAC.11